MSFGEIFLKYRFTLFTLVLVGFASGYSWIKYQPEKWTYEIEVIPETPGAFDEMKRAAIVGDFKNEKKYVIGAASDEHAIDSLFRKFKYLLSSMANRQEFLSKVPTDKKACATEAMDSIKILELDTQVPLLPAYRISATATCVSVNTHLNGFIENLRGRLFSENILVELTLIRDNLIKNNLVRQQLVENVKVLSGGGKSKDQVKLNFSDGTSVTKYEYSAAEINSAVVIDELETNFQQNDKDLEFLLAYINIVNSAPEPAWDADWIIESSAVFSSSKDTNFRLSLLYGFGLSSLLVLGFTILIIIREEFSQQNKG